MNQKAEVEMNQSKNSDGPVDLQERPYLPLCDDKVLSARNESAPVVCGVVVEPQYKMMASVKLTHRYYSADLFLFRL